MGYHTLHELRVRKPGKDQTWSQEEIDELINALTEKEIMGYALTDVFQEIPLCICGNEEVKWYDHDIDMIKISNQFPDYTFQLHGDGEEPDDVWFSYYKDGKHERCLGVVQYKEPTKILWEGDTQW